MFPDWGSRLFEGRESVVDMPFSLACKARADCPNVPGKLFALGSYLADFTPRSGPLPIFPRPPFFLSTRMMASASACPRLTSMPVTNPLVFRPIGPPPTRYASSCKTIPITVARSPKIEVILPVPDPGAPRPFDRSDSGRLSARYLGRHAAPAHLHLRGDVTESFAHWRNGAQC